MMLDILNPQPKEYPNGEPITPKFYKLSALRQGYEIEKGTEMVILNPYQIHIQSIMDVDLDWVHDRNRFYEWLEYAKKQQAANVAFGTDSMNIQTWGDVP